MPTFDEWINVTPERKKIYRQEGLILDVTEGIWAALQEAGWSKQELAAALGCSRPHVTQLLNGSRNMTLRTLADIAGALGRRVEVALVEEHVEAVDEINGWHQFEIVRPSRVKVPVPFPRDADNEDWAENEAA